MSYSDSDRYTNNHLRNINKSLDNLVFAIENILVPEIRAIRKRLEKDKDGNKK